MTTKTVEKNVRPTQPTPEVMQAACQAHTLAQMLYAQMYGQIASQAPWPGVTPSIHAGVDPRLTTCYGAAPGVPCGPAPWCWYGAGWLR
jgi:hypothetical protein